jgi:outer membrane immunogenic protein
MAPSVLLFATGGVAWLQLETTSNCSTVPRAGGNCATDNFFFGTLGPSVITHSQTRIGWTVGAGVEAMLWPNWLARAEYRHADFGTANFTDVRSCTGGCDPVETSPLSISYALRVITRTATIGLAYKFGN